MRPVGRNRFAGTWLGKLPVPLPTEYVTGIDVQRREFEIEKWGYLRGQWRRRGWWYYYVYGLAVKVPLGTWCLVLLALGVGTLLRGYRASWPDELMVIGPAIVVLTLVSLQTGINKHVRYVLPILPFGCIWASRVARAMERRSWKIATLGLAALSWSVTSSLWVYPHSLSYFNELVGGPTGGHAHLLDSNIDWGQDLLYLKRWLHSHPQVQLSGLSYFVPLVDPEIVGIESPHPPRDGPLPGWHAVCVNHLRGRGQEYAYFLRLEPVAMAGYSLYIYQITLQEANGVRRKLGLPAL
jgi:hypothetical protein